MRYFRRLQPIHSSLGYQGIDPKDKLGGREKSIFEERNLKLKAAKQRRKKQMQLQMAQARI
jgi:hypothetical protein